MKVFRNRLRKARIWGYKLGKKYGIGEKVAKANAWADGHRRKTAGILFSVNFCIYLIGFLLCMSQPMFTQLHRIEDMKTVQKNTFVKLGSRVVTLKHEVDSLMAKPNKSHADSVLALAKYEELQTIMNK